ncbi:endolytic transglycosylase MltG [Candidatus Kaiserbacteria bacterium]|nr:endolytic transglycosylase MltG [Candidatus Kaiserbacteria bacterium]
MASEIEQNITENEVELIKTSSFKWTRLFKYLLFLALLGLLGLFLISLELKNLNQAPVLFPINTPITIDEGSGVKQITEQLENSGVVKSKTFLYYALVLFHDPATIKASTYLFEEPLSTLKVAKRLTEGDFDSNLVTFTHYEGERVSKLAERATLLLPQFDSAKFITLAEPFEGQLYPDTYFIPKDFTADDLLNLLHETFNERLNQFESKISAHNLDLNEILILASIIEREANSPESMRMVSGILQNRLEIGMALQADASIEYILDKPLSELTPDDLEIDSPYNTYLYPGLPPTPIGNPGLDAIEAVLNPTKSDYFYYITGNDGEFYYAETYNQHLINIEKYLK